MRVPAVAWRGPRHLETEGGRGDFLKKAKLDGEGVFQIALRPGAGRKDGLV